MVSYVDIVVRYFLFYYFFLLFAIWDFYQVLQESGHDFISYLVCQVVPLIFIL